LCRRSFVAAAVPGRRAAGPEGFESAPCLAGPMPQSVQARPVRRVRPKVRLVAWTQDPYDLAIASARTCYAADFVYVGRLGPKGEEARISLADALPDHAVELAAIGDPRTTEDARAEHVARLQAAAPDDATREAVAAFGRLAQRRAEGDLRIAQSIYEAGHHTPFQHPTFVFALEDVSRNVVECFLHQHTFYNSEQQSQRYVRMDEAVVYIPASVAEDADALAIYQSATAAAWDAYDVLREQLVGANEKTMAAIGRIKGQKEKQIRNEAEKKSQEMARYVIPVAAATKLYHTVSGIVLLRYMRMSQAQTASAEARELVDAMVAAVRAADSRFFDVVEEEPLPRHAHPEWELMGDAPVARDDSHTSVLIQHTPDATAFVATAMREVTGSTRSDGELLARVLDPAANPVWNDTLNTWDHSPLLRALRHVHLTFRKRQSLTAYAQDQRHRLTPGTRPMLQRIVRQPSLDYYTPDVIAKDAAATQLYDATLARLWDAVQELRRLGIPEEDCTYLLPNATNLRYTQSGDLLSFIHKWRLRLCFTAQKEIFEAALDELRQAQAVMPELTRFLGPPCTFVAAALPPEKQDDIAACCPEGSKWCGVKVWKNFDAATGKPKRPY
jgi:thymidylate synthase ThyX